METCALFGSTSYTSEWVYVNALVLAISAAAVALIYVLSKLMPMRLSARVGAITRVELMQLAISAFIIAILLTVSTGVCAMTTSLSQQLDGTGMTPFQYADYYVGNLSLNTGMKLLTYIYSTSIAYGIDAQILSKVSEGIQKTQSLFGTGGGAVSFSINEGLDLGIPYSILSAFYTGLFSPLLTIAIGMLFVQYLALPVIEAVAFTVVLPVALIMRSIAYAGGASNSLRHAANAFLALSIALYIVYPATIAMDSYVTHWIFSAENPGYSYLGMTLNVYSIPSTTFATATSAATSSYIGIVSFTPSIISLLSGFTQLGISQLNPLSVPSDAQYIINTGAQFLFISVVLFALNIAITMTFAQSLTNALNAGIGGPVPFWRSL